MTIELGNVVHLWLVATSIAIIFFVMRWLAGLLIQMGGPSEALGTALGALYQ